MMQQNIANWCADKKAKPQHTWPPGEHLSGLFLTQEEETCGEDDDHHCAALHHLLGSFPHRPHAVRVQ